jgi:hypothetical protein
VQIEQLAAGLQQLEAMGAALGNQQALAAPRESSRAYHWPQLGELGRRSTATSHTRPRRHHAHGLGAAEVHLGDGAIAPGLAEGRLLGAEGIEKGAAVIAKRLEHQLEISCGRDALGD